MPFRSAANSNLVINNLKVNGKLTLEQPITYDDFEVNNLAVSLDTSLNNLYVKGQMTLR